MIYVLFNQIRVDEKYNWDDAVSVILIAFIIIFKSNDRQNE